MPLVEEGGGRSTVAAIKAIAADAEIMSSFMRILRSVRYAE
jgi:hypothetical protein